MVDICDACVVYCSACASAYTDQATAGSICQSGCKFELPAVEYRLHQVSNLTVTLFCIYMLKFTVLLLPTDCLLIYIKMDLYNIAMYTF